jgi:hypothetical protein
MSNLYRGPPIDASYHSSFGSFGQTVSEEKNFKNQPIRNKSPAIFKHILPSDEYFAGK